MWSSRRFLSWVGFFPRPFFRRRSTVIASASPPAIASTVAVSAFRLIVVSVVTIASRSIVAGEASIVAALAVRSTPVTSPAFALAHLATSMARAARLALLAKIVHEHRLGAVTQPLDLVSFERAVDLALRKERLKIRRECFDGLVGQLFARFDVLGTIGAVVRHIVPLHCKLFARRWHLAGGEEFCDAEHLLKTARVVAWRHQQVLSDLVVPARGQIDVLDVRRTDPLRLFRRWWSRRRSGLLGPLARQFCSCLREHSRTGRKSRTSPSPA